METNTTDSVQTSDDSVTVETNETVNNPEAVLAKNRELVGEKKAMAAKLAEYESKMQSINEAKLLAEGNKDEVINSLRDQLSKIETESKEKEQAYNWNTVSSQIREAAASKGCTSPEKLIKLLETDDLNSIEVYDNYKVNTDDLDRVLNKAMKDHSDIGLFKKTAKVDDVVPGNKIASSKKPLDKMTKAEIEAELHKL